MFECLSLRGFAFMSLLYGRVVLVFLRGGIVIYIPDRPMHDGRKDLDFPCLEQGDIP